MTVHTIKNEARLACAECGEVAEEVTVIVVGKQTLVLGPGCRVDLVIRLQGFEQQQEEEKR